MSNIFDVNSGVFQARHVELKYGFTVGGVPLAGITKARYVVYDDAGNTLVQKELGAGVVLADGVFTIQMNKTDTARLVGRLHHELFYEDAMTNENQVFVGRINFTKTRGRFA